MQATMHDLFGVWGDAPLLICVGALTYLLLSGLQRASCNLSRCMV